MPGHLSVVVEFAIDCAVEAADALKLELQRAGQFTWIGAGATGGGAAAKDAIRCSAVGRWELFGNSCTKRRSSSGSLLS